MEMRQLEMLRAVAEQGSFSSAAATLRLTPSAVSQQMAALERTVGQVLFERSTRGVALTAAGSVLARAAQSIQGELTRAQSLLTTLGTGAAQTLTIASFTSAGESIIAPALVELAEHHELPIDVTVLEAEPDDAASAILDGRADLAITYRLGQAHPPDAHVRYRPLLNDALRVIAPARHHLAHASTMSWADLTDESWICGWGALDAVFERIAGEHGLNPRVVCRSSDYSFMQTLVGAGVGLALIPELALTPRHDTATLPLTPGTRRHIGLTIAPNLSQNHPARVFEVILNRQTGKFCTTDREA